MSSQAREDGRASSMRLVPWQEVGQGGPVDYHVHTCHTDGSGSVQEMAQAAVAQGITEILFSEHIRRSSTYFPAMIEEVEGLRMPGLRALAGVEAKVVSLEGGLDCPPEVLARCAAVVGSVHSLPEEAGGRARDWASLDPASGIELEYRLALAIVRGSAADILGHPLGMSVATFSVNPVEKVYGLARACRETGKAFELNARYCPDPPGWVQIVRQVGCRVSLGSDAHAPQQLGSAWRTFVRQGPLGA